MYIFSGILYSMLILPFLKINKERNSLVLKYFYNHMLLPESHIINFVLFYFLSGFLQKLGAFPTLLAMGSSLLLVTGGMYEAIPSLKKFCTLPQE